MKFVNLQIENFLAISEAAVNLNDRGLLLIQGVNEDDTSADSNGAGKSTIADALCWCLYGETARGESGDKVINRKVGKNTRVSIRIQDDGAEYLIERHRKHKTGKNTLTVSMSSGTGERAILTKGTDKLTQEVVNSILGCSYEVFRASIYAGQESFPDLPALTDRNLKTLVEEAAGVTILEAAYEEARKRAAAVKNAALELDRKSELARDAIVDLDNLVTQADKDIKNWAERQQIRVKELIEQAKEAAEKAKSLSGETSDRHAEIKSQIAACDAAIGLVDAEKAEERRLADFKEVESRKAYKADRDYEDAKSAARGLKDKLGDLDHKLGCPCDSCGRPYTEAELKPTFEIISRNLKEALVNLRDKQSLMESAQNSVKSAADALEAFRASMTDLTKTNALRASLMTELNGLEKTLRARDTAIADAKRYRAEAVLLSAEENPLIATKDRLVEKVKTARANIFTIEGERTLANAALGRATTVVEIFSPAGVRAHILDTVTPFLNAQTAKYLSTLSDGNIDATWSTLTKSAKGELREKFAIEVSSRTGGDSFGLISGGEKRKVRLATALALQDLVASRASKPIELFFGDEIDDALDEPGLERLMMILEEKARERGTVLVISHNSLRDWCSNVLLVTKKDGLSTVSEIIE